MATMPGVFRRADSVSRRVGSFVGGVRSLWGAFLGAAFIVLTPSLAVRAYRGGGAPTEEVVDLGSADWPDYIIALRGVE